MLNRFLPALTCAAALAATAAAAETPAPAGIQGQARDFVQSYAAATAKLDQIPRWSDPLCVEVTGLPPDSAAQIKARVEDVAKAVGLKVLPAGCTSNIQVAFTATPQALLDGIAAKQEVFLGYGHRNDKSLRTVTHPIQAWYVTETLGAGGPVAGALFAKMGDQGDSYGLPMQTHDRVLDDPDLWPPTGCGDSRFSVCLRSVFGNVLVVVDLNKAGDKGLGVISDYVAMLALSQPRGLDHCNVLPSITDLFVDSCSTHPDALTPTDAAYLTSLYQADLEARKESEQADIAGRMTKILTSAPAAAR